MTSNETNDSRKDMADAGERTLAKLTGREATEPMSAAAVGFYAANQQLGATILSRPSYRRFTMLLQRSSGGDQMAIQSVLDELCSVLDVQMLHHRVLMKSNRTR